MFIAKHKAAFAFRAQKAYFFITGETSLAVHLEVYGFNFFHFFDQR